MGLGFWVKIGNNFLKKIRVNLSKFWGFLLMRGKFGEISSGRGKINFNLVKKVKLNNKRKLRGIFNPFPINKCNSCQYNI